MQNYDLNVPVNGKSAMEYMADLLERNERQEVEIERGKLSVSILKQMNNRSRLLLDAAKFELKSREFMRETAALEEKALKKDRTNKQVAWQRLIPLCNP